MTQPDNSYSPPASGDIRDLNKSEDSLLLPGENLEHLFIEPVEPEPVNDPRALDPEGYVEHDLAGDLKGTERPNDSLIPTTFPLVPGQEGYVNPPKVQEWLDLYAVDTDFQMSIGSPDFERAEDPELYDRIEGYIQARRVFESNTGALWATMTSRGWGE